jgi:hypothetical protein
MDLLRFDRQNEFTSVEIACLMCGIDPVEPYPKDTIKNDLSLIRTGFLNAFKLCKGDKSFISADGGFERCLFSVSLDEIVAEKNDTPPRTKSVFEKLVRSADDGADEFDMDESNHDDRAIEEYFDYFSNGEFDDAKFLATEFSRVEIAMWLKSTGISSEYSFLKSVEAPPLNVGEVARNPPARLIECHKQAAPVVALPAALVAVPPVVESIVAPIFTATVAPLGDQPNAAVANWKMQIQAEATAHCLRLRKAGANPTRNSILDPMAQWCRDNDIKTDTKIHPSANYLRTHVLGGKHWDVPN